jgi:hypothetical protein
MARTVAVFALALATCESPPDEYPSPLVANKLAPPTWSIVVLPDTQVYAESHPEIFAAQTAWNA